MAVLSQVMQHTPLQGAGLSIPDANKKRFIAKWVDAKEVRNTEWADWAPRRKGDPYDNIDIEIGASYAPFIRTTLGAQAGASDEQLTVATTALLRKGDQLKIEQLYNGSTTEYDDSKTERSTILSVDSATLITVQRHEGEVADGSYTVHPSGSRVSVVSTAESYNEPFKDAITFRGDMMTVHTAAVHPRRDHLRRGRHQGTRLRGSGWALHARHHVLEEGAAGPAQQRPHQWP